MEENTPIKVYVRLNENNEVIEINSEIFIKDLSGCVKIDEGYGDKYAHAQGNYLEKPIINDNGQYNYIYKDNKIIENK